jgi:hypothetical protein
MTTDQQHYDLDQLAIAAWQSGEIVDDAILDLALPALEMGIDAEEVEGIVRTQFQLLDESQTTAQAILRLAGLGTAKFERLRESEAKRLHMRLGVLDAQVEKARAKTKQEESTSATIPTWTPVISNITTAVNGFELLHGISNAIRKFVRLEESEAIIIALWILFTWIFEKCAETNPFLRIVSPEPNCGKSTLLDVLEHLTRAPWLISSSTKSSFIRRAQAERFTLLLDEADAFLQENEEFRNVLDAASRPNGRTGLSVKQGDDWVSTDINIFVPIAIASIKKLRRMETVEQRSIHIWLKRATKEERKALSKARQRALKTMLEPIADRCARWALDNCDQLVAMDPTLDFEDGRDEDKWMPLIGIADYLDAELGKRVRQIAAGMIGETAEDHQSLPILLLGDIKSLFDLRREQQGPNVDKYASEALCDDLAALEDRPWRALPSGRGKEPKPITQNRLALMLKDFRIAPHTIRLGDHTPKGFEYKDFEDAWLRYQPHEKKDDLSKNDGPDRNTATTLGREGESSDLQGATEDPCGSSKNSSFPYRENDCGGVADRNGKNIDTSLFSDSGPDAEVLVFDDEEWLKK